MYETEEILIELIPYISNRTDIDTNIVKEVLVEALEALYELGHIEDYL